MESVVNLINQYQDIDMNEVSDLNKKALIFAQNFLSEPLYLKCCLLAQVRGRITLKSDYDKKLVKSLKILNNIALTDPTALSKTSRYHNEKIVYLCLLKTYLDDENNTIKPARANYCLDLLKTLNISKLYKELSDKLFAIAAPKNHQEVDEIVTQRNIMDSNLKKAVIESLENALSEHKIKAQIWGTKKPLYSIAENLKHQHSFFTQILDFIEVRVVVQNEKDCYRVKDLVVQGYALVNNNISDFIAKPKDNGYQAIHMNVFFKNHPIELQIKTEKMHHLAEYGTTDYNKLKKIS